MKYSQFSKNLKHTIYGVDIQEHIHFNGHVIQKTIHDDILINNEATSFKTLSEAKRHINQNIQVKEIVDNLHEEFFNDNFIKIADVIKEEHGIKVTNNILEQYIKIASDKSFSIDPVIIRIREMNEFDSVIDNKIHYILEDNSKIAVSIETQNVINNILQNNNEAVEYMKKSSDNFLKILDIIIREE